MSVPFLDLKAQYQPIKKDIDAAIQAVIDSSAFALGPAVERFEREFAQYCGTAHCVGLSSGTAAIELLLRAYGIGSGDDVITVTNSFFASAEAISLAGATPVLVDCRESDALMDVNQMEKAMTSKTKAIIPVHLYGQPADMDEIMAIAVKRNLIVIEDACQAHGAKYRGKRTGSLAHAAAFSFYPGKNLGAFGEAGAITTGNDDIAAKVRMLRDHGSSVKYQHRMVGRNDRMDGIQGAVLSEKLKHLDQWNVSRRTNAKLYRTQLSAIEGVTLFETHEDREHNYHLFVIRVANRDAVQKKLQERSIVTIIHYPIPIHLQEAYAGKWKQGRYPVSEKLAGDIFSLPMYAELTEEQVEEVCGALRAALA